MKLPLALAVVLAALTSPGCELCAIYNANDATGESNHGFLFSISEQYIPYETSQVRGREVSPRKPDYVDSSIAHLVPGYNFSPSFGVSLNIPLTHLAFSRTEFQYSATAPPVLFTEKGSESGIGDAALIGRVTIFQKTTMKYGVVVNLLGGVKFPTGDSERLKDELAQTTLFESFLPPGTPHDPLGHSISSVHQHELVLGSGSYDGIFGLAVNTRWRRWFFNGQFQYNLRTEGDFKFQYGDELMLSGGPGAFLLLSQAFTLSLQLNAAYDTMAEDRLLGRRSSLTGMTAWYAGPQVGLTWGQNFSANAGIDVPLRIANNGFQSVPDYRVHGGISLRF
jgi:hypothetical protein